jgi:uncharacterized repeat protein (TIGR01451 family)
VPSTSTIDGIPAAAAALLGNGQAAAVWEVLAAQPNAATDVDLIVWIQTQSGVVSTGPVALAASLAPAPPAFAEAAGHAASTTLPIPRFHPFPTVYPLATIISHALVITTSGNLPNAAAGVPYSQNVTAANGSQPYTFAVTGGYLPSGLTLAAAGALTGSPLLGGYFNFTITVTDHAGATASQEFDLFVAQASSLAIAKSHSGNFVQGQNSAAYNLIVSNASGAGPTNGTVTVTETVPSGMTLVSMAGSGWNCANGSNVCTRGESLNPGASYPPIVATVNVASNAGSPLTNQASVSGGGSAGNNASDSTIVLSAGSTSLVVTPVSSMLSQPVTLTATVTSGATGKITFYDGTTVLAISQISGGQASFSTRLLGAGSHTLRAYYSGDNSHSASQSSAVTATITVLPSANFGTESDYTAGTDPLTVVVGDFNLDGKADLAVLNEGSSNVSILLGRGDGTFQAAINSATGANPYGLAVADFNGDGKPDLATSNIGLENLSILLSNGDGSFQLPLTIALAAPFAVATGDFNGDGMVDLVARGANTVNGSRMGRITLSITSSDQPPRRRRT